MKITTTYFFPPNIVEQSSLECDILPSSLAYFCSTCGEVWGRISCTAEGHTPHWAIENCPCLHHTHRGVQDWSRLPGTITDAFLTERLLSKMWWGRAVEHLPPAVLRQEFDRLMQHHTKEIS